MLNNFRERLNKHQIAKVIYGSILTLVVILTLEEGAAEGIKNGIMMLLTTFAIMLAELYSDVIGSMIESKRSLTQAEWQDYVLNSAAVIVATLLPALWFFLNGLGFISHEASFRLAKWSVILLLGLYGYIASYLAGRSRWWNIVGAVTSILIGLIIVSVKFVLEHS
jgi:hypothetical protein